MEWIGFGIRIGMKKEKNGRKKLKNEAPRQLRGPPRRGESSQRNNGELGYNCVVMRLRGRKWKVLVFLFVVAMIVVSAVLWICGVNCYVSQSQYERLTVGMTLTEVKAICGEPSSYPAISMLDGTYPICWQGWTGIVIVYFDGFDENSKMCSKVFDDSEDFVHLWQPRIRRKF